MENSAENPRKVMAIGTFRWRGGVKPRPTKDRPEPKPQLYPYKERTFFIVGEEKEAWSKILKKYHRTSYKGDVVVIEDDRIEDIETTGLSMVRKDGTVYKPR